MTQRAWSRRALTAARPAATAAALPAARAATQAVVILLAAAAILLAAGTETLAAQEGSISRERLTREWDVKVEKMDTFLRPFMQQHDIQMWIIMSRENHPDPMLKLFGEYGLTGWYGHRNAYIFYDPGDGAPLEAVVFGTHLSRHLERFFPRLVPYGEEGLAPHLREYVHEKDPRTIAINQSRTISMADGLTASLKSYLEETVGPEYVARFVSSEPLVIDYVSHRTPAELEISLEASARTWNIIRRVFSNEVVRPGHTTLLDLHFWVTDEWRSQHLDFNFPASFNLQRRGLAGSLDTYDDPVIEPGDLLHTDFGIDLMGIVTDQQKNAYVLRPDETEPPEGLRRLFAQSVRVAEIFAEELRPGVLGYEVKERVEARAAEEGIDALAYGHAQGTWVHDAGAWAIFDWPERYGIHPREPVRPTEFWSVEFAVTGEVPEWDGQEVRIAREEDGWVGEDGGFHWMSGPQKELWLIRSFDLGR